MGVRFNLDNAIKKNDQASHTAWESMPPVSVAPAGVIHKHSSVFAWFLFALVIASVMTGAAFTYCYSAGDTSK